MGGNGGLYLGEDGLKGEGGDGVPMQLQLCQALIVLHGGAVPIQIVGRAVLCVV